MVSFGAPVCVATAWQYNQIVGELDLSFNDAGQIESCAGVPHMMLADSFKRRNADGDRVEVEGDDRAAIYAAIEADPKLSIVEGDTDAAAVLASFNVKVEEMQSQQIGAVAENLCLARIPGDGRSKLCGSEATAGTSSTAPKVVRNHARRSPPSRMR